MAADERGYSRIRKAYIPIDGRNASRTTNGIDAPCDEVASSRKVISRLPAFAPIERQSQHLIRRNPYVSVATKSFSENTDGMEPVALPTRAIASALSVSALVATATVNAPAPASALMCTPGEFVFAENFGPETVSDRWGFKVDFVLRGGAPLRTNVDPAEGNPVFLKDPSFHNTIFSLTSGRRERRLTFGL